MIYSIRERKNAAKEDFAKAAYYANCGDLEKAAHVARRAISAVRLLNPKRRRCPEIERLVHTPTDEDRKRAQRYLQTQSET